jgi:hypothetical protein
MSNVDGKGDKKKRKELALSYSSKINSYLYHQRVSLLHPLKKHP